ncbi:undecaprenyl-phosphate galactose phosphotransferase WbaP [Dissulfurimicrobium hydrothermale]|uniref:undecaprenyl-phosphate galactose phosphotransferase WbaP n=1 Tax=Dissulfurimicrobium hydrothermale TaxID=1750598 RepID=UPI001EDBCEBA|nr:undecaprenyl-phosphate galactose phosphotransferase WbaP [Dissulfurimicrobium hydrothermale]UKL13945.1 undecaprenyl-phosphate galactose phosphotransferase WbaP [Dissulfurimicrobium hydrothermale]
MNNKLKTVFERAVLFFIDAAAISLILGLSVFVRTDILPILYSGFRGDFSVITFKNIWWFPIVWLFFYYYEGLYTRRFSLWDEVMSIWKVSFLATIGVFTLVSMGKLSGEVSRTVIVLMGGLSLVSLPPIRMAAKAVLRMFGLLKKRVIVLGAGKTGVRIIQALSREPNYGYEILGILDDDPEKAGMRIEGVKVHHGVDNVFKYLKRMRVTDVFIAMPSAGRERLQNLINNLQHKVDGISFVPDMFGVAVLGAELQHFFNEQTFAFEIKNNLARPLNVFVKRSFDMGLSLILLVLLAVPMLVIAIMIRLDSKGPVIFSQERIGRHGRLFKCLKFRTMYLGADEKLNEILEKDPKARAEWEDRWKLKDDPRVTRVGRFLRKTSFDELPQILNVLKGDMSLVGPRPYLPSERSFVMAQGDTILSVLPGITGLWQVSGRNEAPYSDRIGLDTWYVRNWNLGLDVIILMKTIRCVIKQEGAY